MTGAFTGPLTSPDSSSCIVMQKNPLPSTISAVGAAMLEGYRAVLPEFEGSRGPTRMPTRAGPQGWANRRKS